MTEDSLYFQNLWADERHKGCTVVSQLCPGMVLLLRHQNSPSQTLWHLLVTRAMPSLGTVFLGVRAMESGAMCHPGARNKVYLFISFFHPFQKFFFISKTVIISPFFIIVYNFSISWTKIVNCRRMKCFHPSQMLVSSESSPNFSLLCLSES